MIPERYAGFKGYLDGVALEGVVTCEIPQLQAMTQNVSGAGILGEVETPTVGNFSAMSMVINWRTAVRPQALLMETLTPHLIELRGSIQYKDEATGLLSTKQIRISTRARVKNTNYGTAEVSAEGNSTTEFSVEFLAVYIDSVPQVRYDPFNYIFEVYGVDQMASVRNDIS